MTTPIDLIWMDGAPESRSKHVGHFFEPTKSLIISTPNLGPNPPGGRWWPALTLSCQGQTRGGLTPAEDQAIRAVSTLRAGCPEAAFHSLFSAIKKTLRDHPHLSVNAALALQLKSTLDC